MKKQLKLLTVFFSLAAFNVFAQLPVTVVDNTLKIAARSEEVFYYGFAEGDQVVFNFEEVNGKDLKEIEIMEYPASSVFRDYKTKKIHKKINIVKTAVYKFRFLNTAVTGRVCKFNIQRIPKNEKNARFNTTVFWKTIYDTSYANIQEKYLIKKEYKPTTIIPLSEYYINSGTNAMFKGGKSRIVFPVTLPKNTKEWYYVFSASREKEEITKAKSFFNLVGQLSKLIDETGALNFGIDMLSKPPGGNVCDIYLLDVENSRLFKKKETFSYLSSGTRENIKSGVVKMMGKPGETYYIGMKNPDSLFGIEVAIEIVAVLYQEEWGTKGVPELKITARTIPYLQN